MERCRASALAASCSPTSMPAGSGAGQPTVSLPHTWRPLGVRIAFAGLFDGMLAAVVAFTWFSFDAETRAAFTAFQIATLVALGLLAVSPGLRAGPVTRGRRAGQARRGQRLSAARPVRRRRRRLPRPRGPTGCTLDLDDGTTASAIGIQGSDGARAQTALRELRAVLASASTTGNPLTFSLRKCRGTNWRRRGLSRQRGLSPEDRLPRNRRTRRRLSTCGREDHQVGAGAERVRGRGHRLDGDRLARGGVLLGGVDLDPAVPVVHPQGDAVAGRGVEQDDGGRAVLVAVEVPERVVGMTVSRAGSGDTEVVRRPVPRLRADWDQRPSTTSRDEAGTVQLLVVHATGADAQAGAWMRTARRPRSLALPYVRPSAERS